MKNTAFSPCNPGLPALCCSPHTEAAFVNDWYRTTITNHASPPRLQVLGCPPYAARPTLELLQGFNLLVRSARSGSYSLQPEVRRGR